MAIDSLCACIKAVFDWNTCSKLQTNGGKTEVLHLTSRFVKNPSLGSQLRVVGVPVDITSKTRNLGVIMDANFTLSSHINDLCKKKLSSSLTLLAVYGSIYLWTHLSDW